MKAFASWSGGKDCMLAVYRYLALNGNKIEILVNMCHEDEEHSISHGIKKELIKKQGEAIGIPVLQESSDRKNYENNFKGIISRLKKKDITTGIFGDIYLEEHRVWIERVCHETGVKPVFPLWNEDTTELLNEFIELDFKAVTVAVNSDMLSQEWLGRELDSQFLKDISELANIDPCAENGEYHTFVYDGPLFGSSVEFIKGKTLYKENHFFLELSEIK